MRNIRKNILVLLLCCMSGMVWAYDFEVDGIYYSITSFSEPYTVEVAYKDTNYNSYSGDVVVPESVSHNGQDYLVTEIGIRAFYDCTNLTSVSIPNTVLKIGNAAFVGCTSLANVTIPNQVTLIGSRAFYDCSSLTYVTIPNSITWIGDNAFRGCTGLTAVYINSIGAWCEIPSFELVEFSNPLHYAHNLYVNGVLADELDIPGTVTVINDSTFVNCTSLVSVNIPTSVTSIKRGAFAGCGGLTAINVEQGNSRYRSIDGVVFNVAADSLLLCPVGRQGEYIIPNSVMAIKWGAFLDCTGLTSVTIPNTVTSIGDYGYLGAFHGCTGLTSVIIPNSVTALGWGTFSNCTSLTSVTIPNSVVDMGRFTFEKCTSLNSVTIPNSVSLLEDGVFKDCTGLVSITIPNSVTGIVGGLTFSGCTSLKSVIIGSSVTQMADESFLGCTGLDSVIVLSATPPMEVNGHKKYTNDGNSPFGNTNNNKKLIVRCGYHDTYQSSEWGQWFNTIEEDCNLYGITVGETLEGGTLEVSEYEANMGKDVLVYVTEEDGYEIESIVAYNADNPSQIVPISPTGAKYVLTYSFIMMPFPVKVEATFRSTEGINKPSERNGGIIATNIYPNPTNGKLTIEAENLQRISVFNLMGQKIMENTASGNSFECDMSRYGAGIYMMQIETANGIATKRIVVK